jgi:hypothetical protein
VFATSHDVDAVVSAANLQPNMAASVLVTSLVRMTKAMGDEARRNVPLALRNVAVELEREWGLGR